MTNAELIQKIRNEIERLTDELELQARENAEANNGEATDYCFGIVDMQMNLLSFLSTLESEKQMNQDELEEELDRFIASGKSVTVEDCGTYKVSYHDFKKIARHFAEWQKEQDDRLVDIIYQQGIEKGKDEMRDALLEWAKERYQQTISNVGCYTGHSVWQEVIEKLESL